MQGADMNCFEVEESLPAYVEGGLPLREREKIDRHVSDCSACKGSLEFFLALEEVLVERGMDVAPSEEAAGRIISTVRKERFGDLIRSVFSLPVQVGFGLVAAGLVLSRFTGWIEKVISVDFSFFYELTHATSWLAKALAGFSTNWNFLADTSLLGILAFLMLATACFVIDRLKDSA